MSSLEGENLSRLNGPQKAAALLLAMGKDNARRVSEHFSRDEMRLLVDAAKNLPGLSVHEVTSLLDEFGDNYERSGISVGASEFESLFSAEKEVEQDNTSTERKIAIEAAAAKEFFLNEPPMMSAVLLSEMNDQMAAEVLKELDSEKRNEIMNAFLVRRKLEPDLEDALKQSVLELVAGGGSDDEASAQIEKTVSVITFMDENEGEALLAAIEAQDPQAAGIIRRSIFRFSDIGSLEAKDIAKVVDKLETDEITAALAGADSDIQEAVMAPLSQRNKKIVESEVARGGVPADKTDKARRKIAAIVINLAKEGVLALPTR